MKTLSILSTKLSAWGLHLIGRGGSMPGSIGCKVDANILSKLKFNGPVILVTGTNGKTSTANMITDLFEKAGYNVISNRKGDNLKAGIVTTLLTHAKLNGEIKANAVVLECDELNVRHILPFIPVTDFVVNNFFRDQLDRAREMEQLIDSIEKVLPAYRGRLILNANDPNVVRVNLVAKIRLKRQKRPVKENFVLSVGQDLNTVIINIHILVNFIVQSVIFKRQKWIFV